MVTLKDIKISRNRIPVQNAIWVRPVGGFVFKLYYPHGGDWAEMKITDSPIPDPTPIPTPEPEPTPEPSYIYMQRTDCEGNKVIAGKSIPLNARVGNKYFFADGRLKFRSDNIYTMKGKVRRKHVYTYDNGGTFDVYPVIPLLRKDNWQPVLVHIRSKAYYDNNKNNDGINRCLKIVLEGKTVYYTKSDASTLTCDTTSPHFKVVNGHLRHTSKSRIPKFQPNEHSAKQEAKHFDAKLLTYRGAKIKSTKVWHLMGNPDKIPLTLKRQWRCCKLTPFYAHIYIRGNIKEWNVQKVFKIRQIRRNRKTETPTIIRRERIQKTGGSFKSYVFREMLGFK